MSEQPPSQPVAPPPRAPPPGATATPAPPRTRKVQISRQTPSGAGGGGNNNPSVSPRVLQQRAQMHLLRRKLLPVLGLRRFQHARRAERENIVSKLTAAEVAQREHQRVLRQQRAEQEDMQHATPVGAAGAATAAAKPIFLTENQQQADQQQPSAGATAADDGATTLVQRLLRNATRDTVAGVIMDKCPQLRHWGREALETLVSGERAALERFALPDETVVYPNELCVSHGLIVLLHGTLVKVPVPAAHVMKQHYGYLSAVNAILAQQPSQGAFPSAPPPPPPLPSSSTRRGSGTTTSSAAAAAAGSSSTSTSSGLLTPAQLAAALIAVGAPSRSPLNLSSSNPDAEIIRAPAVIGETLVLAETLSNYWLRADGYCQYVVVSAGAIHRALLQQPRAVIYRTLSRDVLAAREVALRQHYSQTPPLLRQSWITKDMEPKTLYRLMLDLEPRSYPPGEDIAVEGSTAPWMVFLRRGEAQLMSGGDVIRRERAGATFGEMSILFGEPRLNTLRSTTICDVWILHKRSVGNVLRMADSQRSVVRKAAKMRRKLLNELPRVHSHLPLRERVPYLRGMPDDIFERMVHKSKAHVFPVGLLMVASSETCDALVLIIQGTAVEQDVRHKKYRGGDVLGQNCLIPHRWVYGISAATMVDSFILARKHVVEALQEWGTLPAAMLHVELEMKELKRHLTKTLLLNPPPSNIATSTVMDRQALRSVLDGNYTEAGGGGNNGAKRKSSDGDDDDDDKNDASDNDSSAGMSRAASAQKGPRRYRRSSSGGRRRSAEVMALMDSPSSAGAGAAEDEDGATADEAALFAKSKHLSYEQRIELKKIAAKRQRFKIRTQGNFATMLVDPQDNPFKKQINTIVSDNFYSKMGWPRDEKRRAKAAGVSPSASQFAQQDGLASASFASTSYGPVSPNSRRSPSAQSFNSAGVSQRTATSSLSGSFRPNNNARAHLTMSPLQAPRDFDAQLRDRGPLAPFARAVEKAEMAVQLAEHNAAVATRRNAAAAAAAAAATSGSAPGEDGDATSSNGASPSVAFMPLGLSDDDISMLGSLRVVWADPRYDRPFMDREEVAATIAPWPSVTHVYLLSQRVRDEDPRRAQKRAAAEALKREQLLHEALQTAADDPDLVRRDTVALPPRLRDSESVAAALDNSTANNNADAENAFAFAPTPPGNDGDGSPSPAPLTKRPSIAHMTRRLSMVKPGAEEAAIAQRLQRRDSLIRGLQQRGGGGGDTPEPSVGGDLSASPSVAHLLPLHQRGGKGAKKGGPAPLVSAEEVEQILGGILARVPARVRQQFELMDGDEGEHAFIGSATHRMNASSSLSWMPSEANRDFLNEALEDISLSLQAQLPAPHNPSRVDPELSPLIMTTADFRAQQAALIAARAAAAAAEAGGAGGAGNSSFGAAGAGDSEATGSHAGGGADDADRDGRGAGAHGRGGVGAGLAAPVPHYARATGSSLAKQQAAKSRSHEEQIAIQLQRSGAAGHHVGSADAADGAGAHDGGGASAAGTAAVDLRGGAVAGGGMFSMRAIVRSRAQRGGDEDDDDLDADADGDDRSGASDSDASSTSDSASDGGRDGSHRGKKRNSKEGDARRSSRSQSRESQRRLLGEDKERKRRKREKKMRKQRQLIEKGLVPQPPSSKRGKLLASQLVIPGAPRSSTAASVKPARGATADAAPTQLPPVQHVAASNSSSARGVGPQPREAEPGADAPLRASTARSASTADGRQQAQRPTTTSALLALERQIKRLPEVIFARPVYSSQVGYCMVPNNTKQKHCSSSGIPKNRADAVSTPASSLSRASDF